MKLVPSSWLHPRPLMEQTTTVTLGAPRVNDIRSFNYIMIVRNLHNACIFCHKHIEHCNNIGLVSLLCSSGEDSYPFKEGRMRMKEHGVEVISYWEAEVVLV